MMKALMNTLMTCAVLGMMCTSAFAGGGGGGGAKGDGTIVVKNETPGTVMAVAVGSAAPGTVSEFLAQGAQFVQPGDTASFSVAAGDHSVSAIFIVDAPPTVLNVDSTTATVVSGQTTNIGSDAVGNLVP